MKLVMKKDGRVMPFEESKLRASILNAFNSIGDIDDYAKTKADNIVAHIQEDPREEITAEELGDIVEKGLMACKKKEVAKSYVLYRDERNRMRGNTTDKTINEIVNGTSTYWTTENSNKNAMIASTQRDYMAGAVSEDISRRQLLPRDVIEAHDEGKIHFHDIDYFLQKIFNCCLINLDDMLQNGTVINKTMIEKPHSFSTACNIATQIMAVVASGQHGGQSVNIAHLAPFVEISRQKIRKETVEELKDIDVSETQLNDIIEKRVKVEINKGVQTMQYQINTLNTSNGQTPFVTLFMYLNDAKTEQEQHDLALIIEEILNQRILGVKDESGAYVSPAFPKLVYVLDENNIHEDSEYYYLTELAAKCSAKRLVPDYVSAKMMRELKINSKTGDGDVYAPMGCRSFLTPDRVKTNLANAKNWSPDKGKYWGRFNQGVVTINLPYVALEAVEKARENNTDILTEFNSNLQQTLELCHKALRCRHERLLGTKTDISPIHWQHGALARLEPGETIDKLLYDGYSTISLGYAGLWECVKALNGQDLTSQEGEKLGLEIMQKLNDACNNWKAKENIDYSVYGTPIESTTFKFAKALKRRFGVIEGISDRDYITNSYHIHVAHKIDAFDKLAIESKFQKLSPGGAISYVETPNMQNNIPAVLEIIKFIYNNIMYAELNTKSDHCLKCGYDGEIILKEKDGKLDWECPQCGNRDHNKLHVTRRTCGYLGSNF